MYEEIIDPKTGIMPLTPHWNTLGSKLMWSHYANSHQGFVVGLDQGFLQKWKGAISGTKSAKEANENGTGLSVFRKEVSYSERMPKLLPCEMKVDEIMITVVTHKSKAWSYESEIRLVMSKFDDEKQHLK